MPPSQLETSATDSTPSGTGAGYWTALLLVTLLLCMPLLTTRYVPLVDYPNHLARVWLLSRYSTDPAVHAIYERGGLTPNMAMDLIVPGLISLFGIYGAGKVFLVTLVCTFVAGCHALGCVAAGRPTWAAQLAAFVVYCSMFLYGFVNLIFAVGLFALAFAAWLACRHRWTVPRLVGVWALTCAAFISHIGAYEFLIVSCGAVSAVELLRRRRSLRHCLLDAVPIALILLPQLAWLVRFGWQSDRWRSTHWGSATHKLIALAAPIHTYQVWADVAVVLGYGILLVLAFRGARSVHVRWPIASALLTLLVAFLACPAELFGWGPADARLILPAAMLTPFALSFELTREFGRRLLLVALAISAARIGTIWATWHWLDERASEAVALFKRLPVGARVYPAFYVAKDHATAKCDHALEHVLLYAVPERHAYVPSLLAWRPATPLVFRVPPRIRPATNASVAPDRVRAYDYVWAYRLPTAVRARLAQSATPVDSAGLFSLWRVTVQ